MKTSPMHSKILLPSLVCLAAFALLAGSARAADPSGNTTTGNTTTTATAAPAPKPAPAKNPVVIMETSQGTVEMEIFADKAPISAKNFLDYVDAGFYNGTVFHRVIPCLLYTSRCV